MALANYADLQASVASWLNRTDLAAGIPDFITLAESRINRDLRVRQMETVALIPTVAGSRTVALPADFLEMRTLRLLTSPPRVLNFATLSALGQAWGDQVGTPVDYAITGGSLVLGPAPGGVHTLEATYYRRIPTLSAGSPTNWLLTRNPDVYLYAALMEAAPYLMDDQRLPVWGQLYDRAIGAVKMDDNGSRWNAATLFVRSDRIAP